MSSNAWDEIAYPFLNFNGCTGMDKQFHPIFYMDAYLSMLGLKLVHVSKKGPWYASWIEEWWFAR